MQAWPRLFTNWEQAESVLWPSWHTKVPLKIARAASGHRVPVCEATSSKATRVQVQCAWSHFLGVFLVVPCSLVTVFLSVQLALTNIDHKTITANFEPLWVCIVVDTFTQVIYHNEQPRVTQYPHVAQLSCRRACSVFCKNRFSVCLLWTSHVWWCKMTRCHKSYRMGSSVSMNHWWIWPDMNRIFCFHWQAFGWNITALRNWQLRQSQG